MNKDTTQLAEEATKLQRIEEEIKFTEVLIASEKKMQDYHVTMLSVSNFFLVLGILFVMYLYKVLPLPTLVSLSLVIAIPLLSTLYLLSSQRKIVRFHKDIKSLSSDKYKILDDKSKWAAGEE